MYAWIPATNSRCNGVATVPLASLTIGSMPLLPAALLTLTGLAALVLGVRLLIRRSGGYSLVRVTLGWGLQVLGVVLVALGSGEDGPVALQIAGGLIGLVGLVPLILGPRPEARSPFVHPPEERDGEVRIRGSAAVTAYSDLELDIEHSVDPAALRCELRITIVGHGTALRCPFIGVTVDHRIPASAFGGVDPAACTYTAVEVTRGIEETLWDPTWTKDPEMRWHIQPLPSWGADPRR